MGVTIVALHGFLGQPADWHPVRAFASELEWLIPDYTADPLLGPQTGLETWSDGFHRWLRRTGIEGPLVCAGYSQGGRLAMHAFEKDPARFAGLILLSAQPGLADDDRPARAARIANDESWARRFESGVWEDVMRDWNAQPVFAGGGTEPARPESLSARERAVNSLRRWSVAGQRDFRPLIARHAARITAVTGQRDEKYDELWRGLKSANPGLTHQSLPACGHRVLFDAPEAVARIISEVRPRRS